MNRDILFINENDLLFSNSVTNNRLNHLPI